MGFEVGGTVGPYKITQYIGRGGMATIYKAHQITLDRDVALKVIHPALKEDESFVQRLKREASIIAKLNHPNIVPVYDYGELDGMSYLVMRFIDGKTLKEILQDQKLGTERILDIIRPVADALSYAHARGVLHRDVKPSNILIDNEGHVYLADFGLARLTQGDDSTISQDMIIGSPQYISPEQAKAEAVDARSDIYSLGIVIYEMFTGRAPFHGDTSYATITAHINQPLPPPRSFNPKVPPAVEKVLEKALAKEREKRFGSVRDMMKALENAVRGPMEADEPVTPLPLLASNSPTQSPRQNPLGRLKGNWQDRSPLLLGAIGILAVCVLVACLFGIAALARQTPFFSARAPTPLLPRSPSPVSTDASGSSTATPVAGLTPSANPTAVTVRPAAPYGRIAYSIATGDSVEQHTIWIAYGDGSNAHAILDAAMWPSIAPDGRQIAYYRMGRESGIYIANIDGSAQRKAIPFDDTCCVSWAPDSKRLVYFKGILKRGGTIFTANVDGSNATEIGPGFNPSWSPDGNRIAYAGCQPNSTQCGIFVYDLKTKWPTLITRDNGGNPQWSPRGDRIVYQADDGRSHINVFVVNADGTGHQQLSYGRGNDGQPDWSRDGNSIFWRSDQNGTAWAIYAMNSDGSNQRLLIRNAPPDGDMWGRESLSGGH